MYRCYNQFIRKTTPRNQCYCNHVDNIIVGVGGHYNKNNHWIRLRKKQQHQHYLPIICSSHVLLLSTTTTTNTTTNTTTSKVKKPKSKEKVVQQLTVEQKSKKEVAVSTTEKKIRSKKQQLTVEQKSKKEVAVSTTEKKRRSKKQQQIIQNESISMNHQIQNNNNNNNMNMNMNINDDDTIIMKNEEHNNNNNNNNNTKKTMNNELQKLYSYKTMTEDNVLHNIEKSQQSINSLNTSSYYDSSSSNNMKITTTKRSKQNSTNNNDKIKATTKTMNWFDIMKDNNNNNNKTLQTNDDKMLRNVQKRDKRIQDEVSNLFNSLIIESPIDINQTIQQDISSNMIQQKQHKEDQLNNSNNNHNNDNDIVSSVAFQDYVNIINIAFSHDKFSLKNTEKPRTMHEIEQVTTYLFSPKPYLDYKNNLDTLQNAIRNHSMNNNNNNMNNNNHNIDNDKDISKQFDQEINKQRNQFQNHMRNVENVKNFNLRLAINVLSHAASECAKNLNELPISFIWEKLKEIGCNCQTTIQKLLYVSSTCMILKPSSSSSSRNRKKSLNNDTNYHQLMGNIESILDILDDADSNDDNNNNTNTNTNTNEAHVVVGDDDNDHDNLENGIELSEEIAIYHDLLHEPTEQTIGIRIRLLVSQGNAIDAEELILSLVNKINMNKKHKDKKKAKSFKLRLRSFQPVLRLQMQQNNLLSALSLYRTMQTISTVYIDVETYIHLLIGLAERSMFCHLKSNDLHLVTGLQKLNFVEPGPKLFDQLVNEMSQDIIQIPENATRMLLDAFIKGYQQEESIQNMPSSSDDEVSSTITTTSTTRTEQRQQLHNDIKNNTIPNEFIANRVYIDPTIGICPKTNIKLRLIDLTIQQKEQLKDSIAKIAEEEQKRYQNSAKAKNNVICARKLLLEFYNWLNERNDGLPYTAIIDGPNVGYYMQNFYDGGFSYHQIQFVLQALERMGETPLIILPEKYTYNSFYNTILIDKNSISQKKYLTIAEKKIRDNLLNSGKLFVVQSGHLDDYYWMLASVSDQSKSRDLLPGNNKSLFVEPGDVNGRWPGNRPVLISNDQMRDHKVEILEPMSYSRWRSNYIVNYSFAAFTGGICSTNPEIGFAPADFYSREIQANQSINDNDNGSMVWHFPIDEYEDEWFCVHLPNSST